LLTAVLVLQACSVGVRGWNWVNGDALSAFAAAATAPANTAVEGASTNGAASALGAAAASCALSRCDDQVDIIEQLLSHLELAKGQNTQLREGLLRARHHTPLLVVNPLGGPRNTEWQLASLLSALLCVWALTRSARGRRRERQLQQLLRDKEAAWRRCIDFLARSAEQTAAGAALPEVEVNGQVRSARTVHQSYVSFVDAQLCTPKPMTACEEAGFVPLRTLAHPVWLGSS
jgi:hypothetical protein